MSLNRFIGNKIRIFRRTAGLSQAQLAEAIGVTYQQVQKYEKGISAITVERLYQIAEALSVSPVMLLPEEGGTHSLKETTDMYGREEERLLYLFRKIRESKLRKAILAFLEQIAL